MPILCGPHKEPYVISRSGKAPAVAFSALTATTIPRNDFRHSNLIMPANLDNTPKQCSI